MGGDFIEETLLLVLTTHDRTEDGINFGRHRLFPCNFSPNWNYPQ